MKNLSIAEAAKELGKSEPYVLRACLDERLVVSVQFCGDSLPYVKLRERVPMEACFPPRTFKTAPLGRCGAITTLNIEHQICDLVMSGSGRLCVEDEYQRAVGRAPTGDSESSPAWAIGIFLTASIADELVLLWELQEYRGDVEPSEFRDDADFQFAKYLPTGSKLVVRRSALAAYLEKL